MRAVSARGGLDGGYSTIAIDGEARQQDAMKLEGTIIENLQAALVSAKRLRGHPVYSDTILFWREMIAQARLEMPEHTRRAQIETLIAALEGELADQRRK